MFVPAHFREDRLEILHQALRQAGLLTLVTLGEDGLEANPLPMVLEPSEGEKGVLYGHLSRSNPQWRRFARAIPALVIAAGPDCYVSPSWYPSKGRTGKVVPTWNYVAVHAYGRLDVFEDAEALLAVVGKLTDRHEQRRSRPWTVAEAPADYLRAQLGGIVGIRLSIDRLEGKWKLSQNRSAGDRQGVIDGLREGGGERERQVAGRMIEGSSGEVGG